MKEKQRANALGVMRKSVKLVFLLTLLLLGGVQAQAASDATMQNKKTVSGVVKDEAGEPIIGAGVMVKGTTVGTITNMDGAFSLSIPADAQTLQFSYVGMQTVELPASGSRTQFNVIMKVDAVLMDEVVVIGYGTRAKKDMSISVSSVKGDELTQRASAFNIMQSVAGKVAGVQNVSMSGRPGGTSALRVRGLGSINAGKDPIYVLDGVIGVDPDIINSANVESIDVLKDAAATAMYGAQGSNGVVLITTKKGKEGKGSITYEGKMGFGFMGRKLDMLNADEYMEVQRRAYAYSGQTMPHLTTPMENLFYYAKDGDNYKYDENGLLIASPKYNTDWQKEMTQTAITNDHIVSFASSNDKTSVYASLGYQSQDGLLKGTNYERYSGTLNVNSKIKDWLRVGLVATVGNRSGNNNDMEGSFNQGALRNMIEMPSIVPVHYEDGTWGRKHDFPLSENAENPLLVVRDRKNEWKSNFSLFSLNATIDFTKKLSFTAQGDYQATNRKEMSYAKAGLFDISENNGGYADISNSDALKLTSENYFTYTDEFFKGQLRSNFILGASWYYNRSESSSSGSEQYFDDSFEYYNLSAGTTWHEPRSGMNQNTMNSYYFRMNHSFRDRYLLGATFRMDGASNFGANNKYGYFPSASLGWRMSEENFFQPLKDVVSQAKLRASYGLVGNASIPNYRTISQYGNGSTVFNKSLDSYVVLTNLGNKDLKWESSHQFNVGLDLSFFDNRLEVILDYYRKSTRDLLFQKQVPYTTGYSNTWTNLGEIVNKGFEATVTSRNIHNRDFLWVTDLVFSTNKLEVADINGETIDTGNNTIAREGEKWASYYVYRRLGTWGLSEVAEAAKYGKKPGDIKYEDVNKDYKIDENDRQIMGSGTPKGSLTMVNTFSYKGLSLMVDLNYTYGFKIMDITNSMLENRPLYSNNVRTILNAWTPENQNTMIAALRLPSDSYFGENEKDSHMLHKGDFLRVRNIALSYTFSPKVLRWLKQVNSLSLGVSAENVFVLTNYPGYDPEVGAFNTDTGQSIDFYAYPRPTTISANLKVVF